jgi:hypothetical protein
VGARAQFGAFRAGLSAFVESESRTGTPYDPVDKNSNGFDEVAVTRQENYTTTEPWGAGPNPDFEYLDEDKRVSSGALASVIYDAFSSVSFILTSDWHFLGSGTNRWFEHFVTADQSEDRLDHKTTGISIDGGVALMPAANLELRLGGGWEWMSYSQTNNSLDPAGATIFNTNNPNHFVETALVGDPNNNVVRSLVLGSTDPTWSYMDDIWRLICGVYWRPSPEVYLFSRMGLSKTTTHNVYNIFDVPTGDVWREEEKIRDGSWKKDYIFGAGVRLRENLFIGAQVEADNSGSSSRNPFEDGVPTSGGTASTNVTGDITTNNNWDVSLTLSTVLQL